MAKKQDAEGARWDDVRVFLAAYRDRSLGVAAVHLELDVSTVSRRLTAFEASLGTRLFDRSRQGLTPLRAAEVVLPAAEAMEAAQARLSRDASALDAEAEGVVRLSVVPGLADTFVAPALPKLRARHPKITLELDVAVRVVDLTRHEAELALRSVQPAGAELVITKVATAQWLAVASRKNVNEWGAVKRWEDIPWIAWDRDLAGLHVARWLAKYAPKADVALRTSHFATQFAAAEAGLAALLMPEPYLRGKLAPIRFSKSLAASAAEWPADDLWLVGHRALRDVPRVAVVWNFLKEIFTPARAPGSPPL